MNAWQHVSAFLARFDEYCFLSEKPPCMQWLWMYSKAIGAYNGFYHRSFAHITASLYCNVLKPLALGVMRDGISEWFLRNFFLPTRIRINEVRVGRYMFLASRIFCQWLMNGWMDKWLNGLSWSHSCIERYISLATNTGTALPEWCARNWGYGMYVLHVLGASNIFLVSQENSLRSP